MTERVIFVESPAQAAHIVAQGLPGIRVALSAEAAQAFDESGQAYEPVCKFTDTYPLADVDEKLTVEVAAAMLELDRFLAERVPSMRFEGPGVFYCQAYPVQYAVGAVLRRAFLMRAVLDALRPREVLAYTGPIDHWFVHDGYERNPWIGPLAALCTRRGIGLELQTGPAVRDHRPLVPRGNLWGRILGKLRAEWRRLMPMDVPPVAGKLAGLRVLVVDVVAFDWIQTVKVLKSASGVECFVAGSEAGDDVNVRVAFSGTLTLPDGTTEKLQVDVPPTPPEEAQAVAAAIDQWCAAHPARLDFLGFELLESLRPHLHSLAKFGPTVLRRSDALAERFIERVKPHALCYMSIGKITDMRLAHVARRHGIPNVTYQHGFAYGVQIMAKDELTDPMNADYFLVYGPKIRPRPDAAFPVRAQYVPVGSARIEEMVHNLRRPRPRGHLRVLWIAETSTRNTLTPSLNEDTRRYRSQVRCFEKLATAAGLRVTYRPYRHSFDFEGTQRWLRGRRFPNVRTDIGSRLEYLIASHDVVICETSSPTTWIEVMALRAPMILFCDPRQTLLVPEFERDLASACHWARDYQALYEVVSRLVDDRERLLAELRAIDPARFVTDYALDRGNCAAHAAAFLSEVCRGGGTFESWRAKSSAA